MKEVLHLQHPILNNRWQNRAVKRCLSFLPPNTPLDPLETSKSKHVTAPEELQDSIAELHHEHLSHSHETLSINLRIISDQHILLMIATQLLLAQLQNIAFLAQGLRQGCEFDGATIVVEKILALSCEGSLIVEDYAIAAIGKEVAHAIFARHVIVADNLIAVLLITAADRLRLALS